jgi:hypothetical protein
VLAKLDRRLQIGSQPSVSLHRVADEACDYVMPDFMRIGGVTRWQRAAAIAAVAGIPISTYLYPEIAAHVMRVAEPTLARVTGLGESGRAAALPSEEWESAYSGYAGAGVGMGRERSSCSPG